MKKIILVFFLLIITFIAGLFAALYMHVQHTPVGKFVASIFQDERLPLAINSKFDGTLYFVTNRQAVVQNNAVIFTNKVSNTISYGMEQIVIPNTHHLGDTLTVDTIKKITLLSEDDFYRHLRERAQKPLILWVHGYKISFDTSSLYIGQIANDLNIDATFVSYDWASSDSLFSYQEDVKRLKASTPPLVTLFNKIVDTVKPTEITVLAHSLGCRLVCMAFDELYKQAKWSDKDLELTNVIFLAPNIDRQEFDENFRHQLLSMIKKLTVYVASDDNALLVSKLLHNTDSLGLPQQFLDTTQLDEIQALLYYQKMLPGKIDIVDVSYYPKKGFTSHLYYKDRPVLEDLHKLIDDATPANKRYLLKYNEAGGASSSYWVVPP